MQHQRLPHHRRLRHARAGAARPTLSPCQLSRHALAALCQCMPCISEAALILRCCRAATSPSAFPFPGAECAQSHVSLPHAALRFALLLSPPSPRAIKGPPVSVCLFTHSHCTSPSPPFPSSSDQPLQFRRHLSSFPASPKAISPLPFLPFPPNPTTRTASPPQAFPPTSLSYPSK